MNLGEFQTILHTLYQGDTDVPSSGTDDWIVRTKLLEAAINAWDSEKGVLWRELWTTLSDASDGDKTTVDDTLSYDCPSDFRFVGGFVRTVDSDGNHTYWQVITPEKAELYKNEDVTAVYFTGNKKTGYDLHFCKEPTAGHTIDYPYYKEPFIPSSSSDVIEMADPYFAIYFALAKLHEFDGAGDRAGLALAQAEARLRAMKARNVMPPWLQENYIPDKDFEVGYGGFGK